MIREWDTNSDVVVAKVREVADSLVKRYNGKRAWIVHFSATKLMPIWRLKKSPLV
jgi:hypothetical protein